MSNFAEKRMQTSYSKKLSDELKQLLEQSSSFKEMETYADILDALSSHGICITIIPTPQYNSCIVNIVIDKTKETITINSSFLEWETAAEYAISRSVQIVETSSDIISNVFSIFETIHEKKLKTAITKLNLSSRTLNALRVNGFETLADMAYVSERYISKLRGIGKESLKECIQVLKSNDMSFNSPVKNMVSKELLDKFNNARPRFR